MTFGAPPDGSIVQSVQAHVYDESCIDPETKRLVGHFNDCECSIGMPCSNPEYWIAIERIENEKRSPTQLETFDRCNRKWAFKYIEGFDEGGSASAELGKKVHSQLERWFKTCERPDPNSEEGKIAESGLHLWPAPQVVDEVEVAIVVSFEGAHYHGLQDVGFRDTVTHLRVVGDHKTTSDFKWAKTADILLEDIQAMVYAAAAMVRHRVSSIELRWGYLRTRGAKTARRVSLVVTLDHVAEVFRRKINPIYFAISEVKKAGKRALDLIPNTDACTDFGGCPHVGRCVISPEERLRSLMSGNQTLHDRLRGAQAIQPPEASLPPGLPSGFGPPPSAPAPQGFQGFPPAPPPQGGPPAPQGWGAPPPPQPPQGFGAPPPPAPAPQAPPPNPFAGVGGPASAPTPQPQAPQGFQGFPLGPPGPVPATVPPVPASQGWGPPPQAAPTPALSPSVTWSPPPVAPPVQGPVPGTHLLGIPTAQPPAAPVGLGHPAVAMVAPWYTLLIDARPTGEADTIEAGEIVSEANRRVCASLGVADYGLVDYGKGAGHLRAACREVLADLGKSPNGLPYVLVDTNDHAQLVCLSVFKESAKLTIRRS